MTASRYAEPSDVYGVLPPGSLPNPARLVSSIDKDTDVFEIDNHNFALNAPLVFRAESGGELPPEIVDGVTHYAIPLTGSTFKVALTVDGLPVDVSATGSNVVVVAPLPMDQWLAWASAIVDDAIPNLVPMSSPVPETVKFVTATLAAKLGLNQTGQSPVVLEEVVEWANKTLAAWAKGQPVRGPITNKSSNLAASGAASGLDPRGWTATSSSGEEVLP